MNVTGLFWFACLEGSFLLRATQCQSLARVLKATEGKLEEELCKDVRDAVIHDHSAKLPQQLECTHSSLTLR